MWYVIKVTFQISEGNVDYTCDKCHLELLLLREKNKAAPLLAKINSR